MTIQSKLRVMSLTFTVIPLAVLYAVGQSSGLTTQYAFHNALAMALMSAVFLGLAGAAVFKGWFFGQQLQKMQQFCQRVKEGSYDSYLPVPNEQSNGEEENELIQLMRDMNWMARNIKLHEGQLRQMLDNLEESRREISEQKAALEVSSGQLAAVVARLRHLLDHAGQGFVTFGADGCVKGEYSAECVVLFNREIGGASLAELLYPADAAQQELVEQILPAVFQATSRLEWQNYLSLLPEETVVAGRQVRLEYKLIQAVEQSEQRELMLILTDITTQRQMEQTVKAEQAAMTMIAKVVARLPEFHQALQDYQAFCRQITDTPSVVSAEELFRAVHTWKGTFAQFGLVQVTEQLHQLEQRLSGGAGGALMPGSWYRWLEQDLAVLTERLGEGFLREADMVKISQQEWATLKIDLANLLPPAWQPAVAKKLTALTYQPLRRLFAGYPDYVAELAANRGKQLQPVVISGGEKKVSPERYQPLVQSLVHVFRNAIAHGLELPEVRVLAGKPAAGQLTCQLTEQEQQWVIEIADDGAGVDTAAIRNKAVAAGLLAATAQPTTDELLQLLFQDGISSQEQADALAGRGVGLAAVRQEVERLHGAIAVHSRPGQGTRFMITVPQASDE